MARQTWMFNVANSTREAREYLLQLHTDPRIRPIYLQALLGSPSWSAGMWGLLPKIDMNKPSDAERKWSVYGIRLDIPSEEDEPLQALYTGSAQNQNTSKGSCMPGELSRIDDHETLFKMPSWELQRLRRDSKALYVHEVGVLPGVQRKYYSLASFPIITEPSYFQARIKLSIYRLETDHTIIVGTLCPLQDVAAERLTAVSQLRIESQKYYDTLRPSMCPSPPWIGLNRVLPTSQNNSLFSTGIESKFSGLAERKRQLYSNTHKLSLDTSDISLLLDKELPSHEIINLSGRIKRLYDNVLREYGMRYEPGSSRCLRLWFPILWGLANHVFEAQLIIGKGEFEYILDWDAVDWERVAQLAQSIAPEDKIHIYSKVLLQHGSMATARFFPQGVSVQVQL